MKKCIENIRLNDVLCFRDCTHNYIDYGKVVGLVNLGPQGSWFLLCLPTHHWDIEQYDILVRRLKQYYSRHTYADGWDKYLYYKFIPTISTNWDKIDILEIKKNAGTSLAYEAKWVTAAP